MTPPSPDEILSALRVDIDRIDEAMHALLIERGGIIERLIAVKARQGGGSAFRPGREAEMMRRLAERHRGPLPLDTVESIWRVIIATFTYVQAPYAVHADTGANGGGVHDSARFHFGFTVPLHGHASAPATVAAVRSAANDLGLVAVGREDGSAAPWWLALREPEAPKIIARLPFVERDDHPAGLPVFVIARPHAATATREVLLLLVERPGERAATLMGRHGAAPVATGLDEAGRAVGLVAVPGQAAAALAGALRADGPGCTVTEVGSHAARHRLPADPPA